LVKGINIIWISIPLLLEALMNNVSNWLILSRLTTTSLVPITCLQL